MRIAILGASSQIAQDLILSFSDNNNHELLLFGRNLLILREWASGVNLNLKYQIQGYGKFNNYQYDIIINFIGAGDPVKIQKMGRKVFHITEKFDNLVLDYLNTFPNTKYIFISSGAVYGGGYKNPVTTNTSAIVNINSFTFDNWYALSKLHTEIRHRNLSDLSIVDVRVFNYFSHTQDMNSKFMITDIVRALRSKKVFRTSPYDITRDFIVPSDFHNLIQSIINFKFINTALDCYTMSPISKFDLLSALEKKFQFRYHIDPSIDVVNATGSKVNYYSVNYEAADIGYYPKYSSVDGIFHEFSYLKF